MYCTGFSYHLYHCLFFLFLPFILPFTRLCMCSFCVLLFLYFLVVHLFVYSYLCSFLVSFLRSFVSLFIGFVALSLCSFPCFFIPSFLCSSISCIPHSLCPQLRFIRPIFVCQYNKRPYRSPLQRNIAVPGSKRCQEENFPKVAWQPPI